ncbi:MAG: hypothetical protein K6E34_00400 [Lachnospiraceae bacterium]|nr:hypothetical protein [Lachnospiraceae bacterium]
MMVSPDYYIREFADSDYNELIGERDRLVDRIREFEEKENMGDRSGDEWRMNPNPEVYYQFSLECLAKLCLLMHERYNSEYVWGDKRLWQKDQS